MPSTTRTPVGIGVSSTGRDIGFGGSANTGCNSSQSSSPLPSIGCPRLSITRPSRPLPMRSDSGRPRPTTRVAREMLPSRPNGESSAMSREKPTTSAHCSSSPCGERNSQSSPSIAFRPDTRSSVPITSWTLPQAAGAGRARSSRSIAFMRLAKAGAGTLSARSSPLSRVGALSSSSVLSIMMRHSRSWIRVATSPPQTASSEASTSSPSPA